MLIYNFIYNDLREPPDPRQFNVSLPISVSLLILKLLSKDADDRYQSTYGIIEDIKQCIEANKHGRLNFEIGSRDVKAVFQVRHGI